MVKCEEYNYVLGWIKLAVDSDACSPVSGDGDARGLYEGLKV